jgi:hypothetical protein
MEDKLCDIIHMNSQYSLDTVTYLSLLNCSHQRTYFSSTEMESSLPSLSIHCFNIVHLGEIYTYVGMGCADVLLSFMGS